MLVFDGQKLRELRKSQQLTQTALAQKVGKKVEHISNYENGYATPPSEVLLSLMEYFQISAQELGKVKETEAA